MSNYEIIIVSIMFFIAMTLLVFVVFGLIALFALERRLRVIVKNVECKLKDLDPAFHAIHKVGTLLDDHLPEPHGWCDVVCRLVALGQAGMHVWNQKHKGRGRKK